MVRKPTTWSIKGIEEDTRDIARAAAERDEQTIGSWIDYAIRVHGGQRPRETGTDDEAVTKAAPTDTVSQNASTQPSAPGLTDKTVLDIIDRELDASTSRLDRALRPMGLALLDLAERMVSVEQNKLDQAQIGSTPDRHQLESAEALGPDEMADDDFGPELPPQAFDEVPGEVPEEPEPERQDPETYSAPPEEDQAPPPPSHDLAPDFDSLDVPMLPTEETDRAREIDRRLRALAGEVDAVDAVDTEPPPPTGDLGPAEIVIEAPAPEPELELPMAFRGLQQSSFDSDSVAAADDVTRDARRRSRRRLRRFFLGTTGLAVASAVGLYVFAGQLGLGQLRQDLDSRLKPAAHQIAEGTAHLWEETTAHIAPMIEQAKTTLFGADQPEVPAPEKAMDDVVEAIPPVEPAQPDQPASGEISGASENTGQKADSAPSSDDMDAAQIAEPAPVEPETAALAPVEETAPPPAVGIAPTPAPSELPVPVPDAAPAPKVSEAPPPAPALPAPPAREPVDTGASAPSESGLQQGERQSLEQRADAGDAKAQHDLALAYLTGAAGTENPELAAELLREAAIQGLPGAQYNLAVLYETGQGVRQDDVRALLWYHSAAEQGHPNAQYNLGVMYAEGRGIPLNFGEAARWFQAAAKQGMARALYNLAVMTDEGLGVTQDKKKALELFGAAAEAGDQRAIEMLSGSGETSSEGGAALNGADGVRTTVDAPAAIVAEIQGELARLGLYSGSIDGLMGPKTRAAIRAFEQSAGLEESGEATAVLLETLKTAKP
ncbi:peptidoglycan-binding protein [Nisaea nitritireducens]|uniref:peptidoglycan-binding protein n=1 Tax=Nisaea nitritireducens TaxID=568392 RepID=UPI00186696CB|nr:SEL1-like repeat protein [Nisaea nitritireducens]